MSTTTRFAPITRFAPSPTGYLHLGHAYSALFAEAAARAGGGIFLLRLEDIDPVRCRPEFAEAIFEDLHWLGLTWPEPVRRQSDHMADYRMALERLAAQGLLYPCFCTRAEIAAEIAASGHAPHGADGPPYPGTCRHLSAAARASRIAAGVSYVLRLDSAAAAAATGPLFWDDADLGRRTVDMARHGDVVLARKDVPTSYHLSVTVDDALQGVTLVTRALDLVPATDVHRTLQALLGLPVPRYRHHPLLTDESGRRYAKRDRSLTLRSLRQSGHTAADVRRMAMPVGRQRQ